MSSRQHKRRGSDDPLSSRPAKRGRQTEPISPHERALVQARRLAQVRSHVEIDEDVLARLSRQRPKGWTTSDEQTVNDEWNLSIVKTSSRAFANNQHSNLLNLWKLSLRIYKMNPVKMISPLVSLRYQAMVSGKSAERDDDHVIYSPNFCSTLSSLMVHPCFEENIDKLIQALHYAIMCRLDDRTMWPCGQELGTDCPALENLVSKLEACGDSVPQHPIHEMHASARARVLEKGGRPSRWSDFLYHIGETVSKDDARRPPTDAKYRREMGRDVLPLTLWDLRKIVKAIDTMSFRKREWRFPVSEAVSAWNQVKKSHKDSPTMKQLPDFYEHYTKELFRIIRLRESGRKYELEAGPESESEFDSEEESEEELEQELEDARSHGSSSDLDEVVDSSSSPDGIALPRPSPSDSRRSNSNERGNNHGDGGITGTIDGLGVEDESLLASTRHTERPNVPHTVRGQSQFTFAEDVEDDGRASPGLSSVHDTLMYKCLRRDFDRLQARVTSLEQSNMHLTCDAIANRRKIESLESEVDRLSDDNGKHLENIEILSEERLGFYDMFDSFQRQIDDLKRQVTSRARDGMSPYTIFGRTRERLSQYQIEDANEQGDQLFPTQSPARTILPQSERDSVPRSTESVKTSDLPETEHQSASGDDAEPKRSSPAPEADQPSAPEVPLEYEMTSEIELPTHHSEPEQTQETSVPEQQTAHIVSLEPDIIMDSRQANDKPEVAEEVRQSNKPVRSINTVKPRKYVSHGGIGSIGRRAPFSSTMKHTFRMSRIEWLEHVVQDRN